MDSTELADIPSVRLASGVEMQQRWPANYQQQPEQKTGEPPRLIEIAPTRGVQGTVVTIVVQSLPHPMVPVKLAFNSLVVDTKQMQAQGITSLVATVPPFQHTHSTSANIPISICMLDKDSVTETWPVAEFLYEFTDAKEPSTNAPTVTPSVSNSSSIDYDANDKQTSSYQPRGENFLGGTTPSTYESFYQQPVNSYSNMPQYNYSLNRDVYNDNKYNSYRPNNQPRTTNTQMNPINYNNNANSINLFNPTSTGFAGMLAGFDQNDSQALPSTMPQQSGSLGYPQQQQQQQQQHQQHQQQQQQQRQPPSNTAAGYGYSKSSVHVPSTSVANYQPYPGLVSRANLKIMGDLDSMAKNWASEEWEHRRRLVQFWREQNGNEIRCTFDPVAQGERITNNSGHIVVSCIYWAERNDCFITSVDCIHLLESLMDIRFSVEEKNRVRRNLEGFRPLTVSKCKSESADFFKLIMSFPNPKPRNIEKDVKVFPWKTLPYALKKIVTKYTASSYNGNQQQQQQRRTQLKTPASTPPATTPSYMNQSAAVDSFYQTYQQQPMNTYSSRSQQQQSSERTMYPSTSSSFTSSYSQPITSSPPLGEKHQNSPSPTRLSYPYGDMITPTTSTSTISTQQSPSLTRRASPDNQSSYLV